MTFPMGPCRAVCALGVPLGAVHGMLDGGFSMACSTVCVPWRVHITRWVACVSHEAWWQGEGVVSRVHVKENSTVEPGQTIMTITVRPPAGTGPALTCPRHLPGQQA